MKFIFKPLDQINRIAACKHSKSNLCITRCFIRFSCFRSATEATSLKRSRRFRNATWRLVGKSVFYGVLIQVGMMQSKALICRLCKTYLPGLTVREFWVLFAVTFAFFTLLNWTLSRMFNQLVSNEIPVAKKRQIVYFNEKIPKRTRTGAVYGYM